MHNVIPHRFVEAQALLPMLHVPQLPGRQVAVAGPYAEVMAAEVHRWPDVSVIYLLEKPRQVSGKKYKHVEELPEVDAILLSPEQDPSLWFKHLKQGGIIQATTTKGDRWNALSRRMRELVGNSVPWREHLPEVLYGVIGHKGGTSARRVRRPPKAALRLTDSYLPCLFTFGKDELSLALGTKAPTIPRG
jgi:hypothetical protein